MQININIPCTILIHEENTDFDFSYDSSLVNLENIKGKGFTTFLKHLWEDISTHLSEEDSIPKGRVSLLITDKTYEAFKKYNEELYVEAESNRILSKLDYESKKSVYVLVDDTDIIKIGITKNFNKRLQTIKSASGRNIIDYYCTSAQLGAAGIEKALHNKFSDHRINGEWFKDLHFDSVVEELKAMNGYGSIL